MLIKHCGVIFKERLLFSFEMPKLHLNSLWGGWQPELVAKQLMLPRRSKPLSSRELQWLTLG